MGSDLTGTLAVSREAFADPPWLDTAIAHVVLERVTHREAPETLRLYRPARVLAFGPGDRLSPGYAQARDTARATGFAPVERLAGGRAAVFHEGTIAFAWTVPDERARITIHQRFEAVSEIVCDALRRLGVDARVGRVAGEYCPGDYSVNARGRRKLMGVGQRVAREGAHVGGVIVVEDAEAIRDVLLPVNRALGIEWDPDTVGAVGNEVAGATWDAVANGVLAAFAERRSIREQPIDPAIIEAARTLAPRFDQTAAGVPA